MVNVFSDGNYEVFKTDDGFIIQNKDMDGFCHTHIKNYKTCIYLINLSKKKKCPNDTPRYLLISLMRINERGEYTNKIEQLLNKERKRCYNNNSIYGYRAC